MDTASAAPAPIPMMTLPLVDPAAVVAPVVDAVIEPVRDPEEWVPLEVLEGPDPLGVVLGHLGGELPAEVAERPTWRGVPIPLLVVIGEDGTPNFGLVSEVQRGAVIGDGRCAVCGNAVGQHRQVGAGGARGYPIIDAFPGTLAFLADPDQVKKGQAEGQSVLFLDAAMHVPCARLALALLRSMAVLPGTTPTVDVALVAIYVTRSYQPVLHLDVRFNQVISATALAKARPARRVLSI